jgi:hypothetical protein
MKKTVLSTIANSGNKKFKIPKSKDKNTERDADIEILGNDPDNDLVVQKLSLDDVNEAGLPELPAKYGNDDIVWFTNFSIKKNSTKDYINQPYKVKIEGLSAAKAAGKKILIIDGNSSGNVPTVINDKVDNNDTIELTDGDPAVGSSPP